jgi:hypothetical protein
MGHIGKGPNQNLCRTAQKLWDSLLAALGSDFQKWTTASEPQRVNHNIAVCFSKRAQLLALGAICFFYDSPGAKACSRSMRSRWRYNLFGVNSWKRYLMTNLV